MRDSLRLRDGVLPRMDRGRSLPDGMDLKGRFDVQLFDALGNPLTPKIKTPNGITTTAKNKLFDAFFNNGTRWTSWFAGLIDNSGFSALSAGDMMGSHTGWTEFSSYLLSDDNTVNRATWGQGAASSSQITNASQILFKFSSSGSVAGIFICSDQVKGDWSTSELLWSTALFAAPLSVATDDQLRVTYTVSA